MALYLKSDMVYHDYSWTTYSNDNPKITGEPDNTLLNRKEGYEVLYFINKYADLHNYKLITTGEKIERMIREKVPSNIHSQKDVKKWIEDHWSSN